MASSTASMKDGAGRAPGSITGCAPASETHGSCLPSAMSEASERAASNTARTCSPESPSAGARGSSPALRKTSSAYLLGRPSVLPAQRTASVAETVFANSPGLAASTSIPLAGGGAYSRPTASLRWRTSMECSRASIFICPSHSTRLPPPNSSAASTYSLSKLEKCR